MSDPDSTPTTTTDDTTHDSEYASDQTHDQDTAGEREYDFALDPTADAAEAETAHDAATQSDSDSVGDFDAVLAQNEVLQEENRRLRADYVRARQSRYWRAALALCLFAGLAGGGGLLFPAGRDLLGGLAGIGFVMAILIYYLTPRQATSATVGERSYATLARLEQELSAELGLQETQIYVPTATAPGATRDDVRLFVPLRQTYTVPEPASLTSMFLVETDDEQTRGVSLPPTGDALLREFRQSMVDDLGTTPAELAPQLSEALTTGFELVEDAVIDVAADEGTATIGVQGSTFGSVARFDHPVPSFVATGLAVGLQTPVELAAISTDDDAFDAVLTCTWEPRREEQSASPAEGDQDPVSEAESTHD